MTGERRERWTFLLAVAAVLAYLVARAFRVSFTHDEAMTFFTYVRTGDFLPFHAQPDAGNHLLATVLGWCMHTLFGDTAWALRMPSLLAFVLHAAYAYHIGRTWTDAWVRRSAWCALLLTPLVIEFFALFRGYGPSIGLLLMALYHSAVALRTGAQRHAAWSMLAFALATAANLNLLVMWSAAAAWLLVNGLAVDKAWREALWALPALAAWLLLLLHALALRDYGALYYGTNEGLLHGSVGSLLSMGWGVTSSFVLHLVPVLLFAMIATLFARRPTKRDPMLLLVLLLLVADLLSRVVMHRFFGSPYPEDRTAMHWMPLFLIALATTMDRWCGVHAWMRYTSMILLAFPLRVIAMANTTHTVSWPEQAVPDRFMDLVAERRATSGRALSLGAYHQYGPGWAFSMAEAGHAVVIADGSTFPLGPHDLRIADARFPQAATGYRVLAEAEECGLRLLERSEPLALTTVHEADMQLPMERVDFRNLWDLQGDALAGHALLLELDAHVTATDRPFTAFLVVEVQAAGTKAHYAAWPLHQLRSQWNDDELRLTMPVPRLPADVQRVTWYLWDREQGGYAMHGRVRVHRVD